MHFKDKKKLADMVEILCEIEETQNGVLQMMVLQISSQVISAALLVEISSHVLGQALLDT